MFYPDLVILDIMMPDMDGITACRRLREFSQVPIILVTAKDSQEDKVEGLEAGADDYVTKPVSVEELVARVRAVLRRGRVPDEPIGPALYFDDMEVDFNRRQVRVRGKEVYLTNIEYKLLACLAGNAGKVLTPDQLLDKIWGKEYIGATHTLQVNIARLRHKLSDPVKNPKYILTRPGIGYMVSKHA